MTITQLIALKAQPNHFKQLSEIKIADVVFAFSNNKLIDELKVRGQAIVAQKWDQFKKSEQKIQALLTDTASLTRPTSAFITFEEEEAITFALNQEDGV